MLVGRTAIVTGGGRGIGAAFSIGLAKAGASVLVADIEEGAAKDVAASIRNGGGTAIHCGVDVTKVDQVNAMVRAADEAFGGVDVLINNAAMYAALKRSSFFDISPDEFDRVLAVNVKGAWLTTSSVFPSMRARGQGKIINVSSSSVFTATNRLAHYVASKAGIIGLTRALARELGDYNICVNALLPGMTDSQSNGAITSAERHDEEASARSIKRVQVPDDLVGTAVYLASDASNFVTGQSLLVDGGRYFH